MNFYKRLLVRGINNIIYMFPRFLHHFSGNRLLEKWYKGMERNLFYAELVLIKFTSGFADQEKGIKQCSSPIQITCTSRIMTKGLSMSDGKLLILNNLSRNRQDDWCIHNRN